MRPEDQGSQINDYIREARAAGMSDDRIRDELLGAGQPETEVVRALSAPRRGTKKTRWFIFALVVLLASSYVLFRKLALPPPRESEQVPETSAIRVADIPTPSTAAAVMPTSIPSSGRLTRLIQSQENIATVREKSYAPASYERLLDDTWSLYFSLSTVTSENFSVYLQDRMTGNVALIGRVTARTPGGTADYEVGWHNAEIIRVVYSAGDAGAVWEESFYFDTKEGQPVIGYKVDGLGRVLINKSGKLYTLDRLIERQPEDGCDFGGPEYGRVVIAVKDMLQNGKELSILSEPVTVEGDPGSVCGSFSFEKFTMSEDLRTAKLKWKNLPPFTLSAGDSEGVKLIRSGMTTP